MAFSEMSVGVGMDHYPAVRLYADAGFRQVLFAGEDAQGKYLKLLKQL